MSKPQVIELTKSLCAIPSVTGAEKDVTDFVAEVLKGEGYGVEYQTLPGGDRSNIFAVMPGASPKILLTTHLDTVPPHFKTTVSQDGEWLIGRGVCDAKGIIAAMICAASELPAPLKKQVALLFVVGEETVSDGAKFAAKHMTNRFDFVVNGEPTDLKLASSMKGALVFEMQTTGKAGHSAYPETGQSAVHQLVSDASRILEFGWPHSVEFGQTTVNIGTIKGGEAPNVIAPSAHLNGVIRLACSVSEGGKILEGLIDPSTSIQVLSTSDPRQLFTMTGEIETCQVSYGCDIPHLEKLGTPLLFGPGSILDAHTDHEKVRISDLKQAVSMFSKICENLLSPKI